MADRAWTTVTLYVTGYLVEKTLALDNVFVISMIFTYFAVFLIVTGINMLVLMDQKPDISNNPLLKFMRKRLRVTETLHGERFWVKLPDPKTGAVVTWATLLFLCLVLVEVADLVFAILGLRALYFALAAMVHRFHYLKYALALVLVLIGVKIFLGDLMFDGKVPASMSLSVTTGLLAAGILYSWWKTRRGTEG